MVPPPTPPTSTPKPTTSPRSPSPQILKKGRFPSRSTPPWRKRKVAKVVDDDSSGEDNSARGRKRKVAKVVDDDSSGEDNSARGGGRVSDDSPEPRGSDEKPLPKWRPKRSYDQSDACDEKTSDAHASSAAEPGSEDESTTRDSVSSPIRSRVPQPLRPQPPPGPPPGFPLKGSVLRSSQPRTPPRKWRRGAV